MSELSIIETESGPWRIAHCIGADPAAVRAAVEGPLAVIKRSRKAETGRAGDWVVKRSAPGLRQRLKHAFSEPDGRRAWTAAQRLAACGAPIPAPVAYAEARWGERVLQWATVFEHLDGYESVEAEARRLVRTNAGGRAVSAWLAALAAAIAQVSAAGAHHGDLSGKNILYRDGRFAVIDLEAVRLDQPPNREERLEACVQLYDSFCDYWDHAVLQQFLSGFESEARDPAWMTEVRRRERRRRARILARWHRQRRKEPAPDA